ncbi:ATP-binding protein [Testudinibacter sp. TR-2022]|uniref:ATP-binding protein n=1 Tax=Testudinibacter sp. TR-2022 TaxID=2585029 RepID=UPI00111874BB|nr:ATP-binding protein [Testudinibacter sp. TR-2022]TNH02450.1 ATP-binding protein [Pasteurellaceae bacterium Phil31]TNH09894.1 ATP-binding protein [Testudinibacter sp. TR-2022]TNH10576.1 ATP-binding protein [Testudinibacter sp. TR-2022]TNH13647.1 ATP-binding protein [Testudinibacter sp. TR-2022]TNH18145.1 ATP-binding protein [Testudinibacter sp. TR-2022]
MQRQILTSLHAWKAKTKRKPLIIQGARQVGKTWTMKTFGAAAFEQVAYINFDNNSRMQTLFDGDFDIARLLLGLSIESGVNINPDNTLLIFDEVQEVPQALSALKYFYENAPHLYIMAAGSLLGVALHKGTSFPVGKVEFLSLYPMDFSEFLLAVGEKPLLDLLHSQDWALIAAMKSKYIERLRQYYFVGGMPEAVQTFVDTQNLQAVRSVQQDLLLAYEQDFSKHIDDPRLVMRVRALWNALPQQLAKENKKFVLSEMQKGARFKDYELALQWLKDSGLVQPVYRIKKPHLPLTAYQENIFKLYCLDVGLLAAKSQLDPQVLLEQNRLFTEFKGALTEQYVLQQLQANQPNPVFYWAAEKGTAEVDFVLQQGQEIVPIEVKAEENLKAKSLKSYCEQFQPKSAVRTSMSDYRQEDWLTNVPLYGVVSGDDV